ncbi:putative RiPP precursor [Cryobacterium sp. SO2]|nr:putative RiPP precursor [Cryobacterium sp. SO2]WEO78734.1 putative RiPP precursor [Cryobacterium sp. SO2]
MNKSAYISPSVQTLGEFKSVTNGVWFGSWRDIFGGRAFIAIG